MKLNRIKILAIILVVVSMLTACGGDSSVLEIYKVAKGDTYLEIMTGVKSEKTDFKVDDITLDFCFGSRRDLSLDSWYNDGHHHTVGVGVYFCNPKNIDELQLLREESGIENYKEIAGLYFVRFIEMEEYNTDDYRVVNVSFFRKTKFKNFKHKETLTVPTSVIKPDDKYFCFAVIPIVYIEDKDVYSCDQIGVLKIEYEFLDEETVRLSDPWA